MTFSAGPTSSSLVVGGTQWTTSIDPGVTWCRLEKLEFETGNTEIRAMITEGAKNRGALQLDISAARQ